jgi:hypothetical protein
MMGTSPMRWVTHPASAALTMMMARAGTNSGTSPAA